MENKNIAIIGSGATAIFLLKHICDNIRILHEEVQGISIFERAGYMGMGMPYSPETTDIYNLANISSEEIPELPMTFGNWLRKQDNETLLKLNITELPIEDSEVYSRLAVGSYFREQYIELIRRLRKAGVLIEEMQGEGVTDIDLDVKKDEITVRTDYGDYSNFSKVIIATGHAWNEKDRPENGYYGCPWPIRKILPAEGTAYNYTIGTLGASLSAFDVATSLAHRHGRFIADGNTLTYQLRDSAEGFKIRMHSAEGWLPHLQYEQQEPIREIYRHTSREEMLSLLDKRGFLRIDIFFNKVCRRALTKALKKDGLEEKARELEKPDFGFREFVKMMADDHEYCDSFEGMKKEMVTAKDSVTNNRPIHWKETLDDLMYCLNFHAELLTGEDHLFFKREISSFLMNVIAALPLSSANILLALYDAGCIELVAGKVNVLEETTDTGKTLIEIKTEDGKTEIMEYRMFVNCAGQKSVQLDDFPFTSLVRSGHLRKARAEIGNRADLKKLLNSPDSESIFVDDGAHFLYTGGIDIDAAYRIIGNDGLPNDRVIDISFTHTTGTRPYSYGLQACNATSEILVESWTATKGDTPFDADIENMTILFDENEL